MYNLYSSLWYFYCIIISFLLYQYDLLYYDLCVWIILSNLCNVGWILLSIILGIIIGFRLVVCLSLWVVLILFNRLTYVFFLHFERIPNIIHLTDNAQLDHNHHLLLTFEEAVFFFIVPHHLNCHNLHHHFELVFMVQVIILTLLTRLRHHLHHFLSFSLVISSLGFFSFFFFSLISAFLTFIELNFHQFWAEISFLWFSHILFFFHINFLLFNINLFEIEQSCLYDILIYNWLSLVHQISSLFIFIFIFPGVFSYVILFPWNLLIYGAFLISLIVSFVILKQLPET